MNGSYPPELYDRHREMIQRSARLVVPRILARWEPLSVIDVGCGEGWWAREFQDAGADVVGLDGARIKSPAIKDLRSVDLEEPIDLDRSFDLALCLEVAEHLSFGRGSGLVADLCALAPVVIFSAASPGQGGAGHINEQPESFWVEQFASRGYMASLGLRVEIAGMKEIASWYRANIICFAR